MLLDHMTTRAYADHGKVWSDFVGEWWKSVVPPLRRPVRRKPPTRLA